LEFFVMRLRLQLLPAAMILLGAPVGPAAAAPGGAQAGAFARSSGDVNPVAVRCGRKGQGPCRALRAPPAGSAYAPSDYYVHDANKLPFGSERWRDQMRRENRLGNPG
jgi:hypothetical protein